MVFELVCSPNTHPELPLGASPENTVENSGKAAGSGTGPLFGEKHPHQILAVVEHLNIQKNYNKLTIVHFYIFNCAMLLSKHIICFGTSKDHT